MRGIKSIVAASIIGLCFSQIDQASAENGIRKATVSQWIQPAETGLFECQVIVPPHLGKPTGLSNATVVVTGTNARKAEAVTDEQGIAKIPGITPGDYTLTVWAEGYVAWQSLHVIGMDDERFGKLPNQAVVTPAIVSLELFAQIVDPYVSSVPKLNSDTEEESSNPAAQQIKGVTIPEVFMRNGGMEGQVVAPFLSRENVDEHKELNAVENHLVFLIDKDENLHQTVTDEEGQFFVQNLSAGIYSVIIVGRGGIGASSVDLLDPASNSTSLLSTTDGKRFVTTLEPEDSFTIEITPDYENLSVLAFAEQGAAPTNSASAGGGNLIGAALLGTAAAVGTSAYTTSTADSESTDPGGI